MHWSEIQEHDTVTAVFAPDNPDSLSDDGRAMIGQRFTWTAAWLAEHRPAHVDWLFMTLSPEDQSRTGVRWVLALDLVDIELVLADEIEKGSE